MFIASAASPNTNTPAPAPDTPVAPAPPVAANTPPVNAPVATLGMQLVESVNQVAPSVRCIIVTALAPAVKSPARMAGL